jgi:ring-1,2-phenylacetyl-CoA epoxidase subunit PaaD
MVTPEQRALMDAAHAAAPRPSLGAIWTALESVSDPEIPVVSVIELGIVRGVEWSATDPHSLTVRVTPTYSGCPATDYIVAAIRAELGTLGIRHLDVVTELAPPWSTAWITPEGKRKLRQYGIAPPSGNGAATTVVDTSGIRRRQRGDAVVRCPRCGSAQTEVVAQFGSTACKAQYRCTDCLEPFDYFKPL